MSAHWFELIPVALIIIIPLSVQAGLLTRSGETVDGLVNEAPMVAQPVDVKLLTAHNTPNPLLSQGGGDIIVTDGSLTPGGLSGDTVLATDTYKSGEITLYQVREGDTLSQIAEMFSVTSNTILWANDLSSATSIRPGDVLIILPIVGVQHIVKSGDTIVSIAKKYEGDAEEIRSFNRLSDDVELAIGDTIVVPGGNMHVAAATIKSAVSQSGSRSSAAATGSFVHPAPGTVKTQGVHGFNAVDFGGSIGTTVRAAANGTVIVSKSSGWNGGYGNYIVIRHSNGTQSLYAHLSSNAVGVGAVVGAGDTIGAIGNTGRSTGPHLHFEVRGGRNPF